MLTACTVTMPLADCQKGQCHPIQSYPRVGLTRVSGRIGVGSDQVVSRFCRIVAGRVRSALRFFLFFFTDNFLVPEYYIRIDGFYTGIYINTTAIDCLWIVTHM